MGNKHRLKEDDSKEGAISEEMVYQNVGGGSPALIVPLVYNGRFNDISHNNPLM